MSYFSGCHCHINVVIMIFFFFVCLEASTAKQGDAEKIPLNEFWSREELVQLGGYGEEKLSNVLVTGTLLCEACLRGESQLHAWPISGALVSVQCHRSKKRGRTSSARAITDEYGDFLIDLPSHLHAIPNLEKTCSVKVLRIPKNSVCQPAYVRKHTALILSSVGNGIRTYSAGNIKLLHWTSKLLQACTKTGSNHKQIAW